MAIETDVTSKTTLDAYEAIGVPELWIYARNTFTIYVLQSQKYVESPFSPVFPDIALTKIIPATVERVWQLGNVQALEEFEAIIYQP